MPKNKKIYKLIGFKPGSYYWNSFRFSGDTTDQIVLKKMFLAGADFVEHSSIS